MNLIDLMLTKYTTEFIIFLSEYIRSEDEEKYNINFCKYSLIMIFIVMTHT
jgi:hypothetical protein